jgi:hypothetical protein
MAVRYLRDTLQYRFPEIATRAAAAEAEQHAREEREQAALRVRLAALLAPSGEWRDGMDAAAELLIEMGECFAILEEQPGQQQQPAAGEAPELGQRRREEGAMPVAAAAVEGLEWEDVATEAAAPAAAGAEAAGADAALEQEGLAAYAASDAADAAAGTAEAAGGSTAAELEVVLETLAGLYRQLTNRTLPQVLVGGCGQLPNGPECFLPADSLSTGHHSDCLQCSASYDPQFRPWLQEWLQVLGRVEPEGPQQEQARQAMLRSATELRGRLVAARERCDAASLDLEALLLQRRRREEQRQEEGAQQAAVAAAVQDLFGDSDGSDAGSSGDDAEEMQQAGQKKQTPGGRQHPQNTAAGPSGSRQPQPWQRQQARRRQAPVDDADNPYLHIVDPAAPRPLLQQRSPAAAAAAAAASAAAKAAAAGQQRRSSSLPVEVRRKLAEQVCPAACLAFDGMLEWAGHVLADKQAHVLGLNLTMFHWPCRPRCSPPAPTQCSGTAKQVGTCPWAAGLLAGMIAFSAALPFIRPSVTSCWCCVCQPSDSRPTLYYICRATPAMPCLAMPCLQCPPL